MHLNTSFVLCAVGCSLLMVFLHPYRRARPTTWVTFGLRQVLQVLADVFQAPVFTAKASDSAAVGAALRAKHGLECQRRGGVYVPFGDVFG